MVDVRHYTYRLTWSEEDGEYVGLCAEFPSLSHLDSDQAAALAGIVSLVADVVSEMAASGETPPQPIADRHYSGRFQVRTTPELHRRLALRAAEANLSLNRIVNDQLSKL
ncbi:MAG: type II toxin-antitoxin system HicB family antitoxin [Chromatiaceae bacterium]|jgi:predicted HicB family RNase H-like nuclease|nr:type II toxin-antitoxin system HicB family antitoxin [Chromatiaceae bacterium]